MAQITKEQTEKTQPQPQQQSVSQKNGGQTEQQRAMTRREQALPGSWTSSPFTFMRRFSEEMDRLFDDFGMGRNWLPSRLWNEGKFGQGMWSPAIEVFERDNQFIVRADLPGLTKDEVKVECKDDEITIQGERRQEHEETKEGYRHSERSYGSFYRSIPLPEGIDAEKAKATFREGVLEIVLPAPQRQEQQGRRIEIQ